MRGAKLILLGSKTTGGLPFFPEWDEAVWDTDGFWSVLEPTRITIPAGISKIRLRFGTRFNDYGFSGSIFLAASKGAARVTAYHGSGVSHARGTAEDARNIDHAVSGVLTVVEGDYFELRANALGFSGGESNLTGLLADPRTYFEVVVLEAT